MGQIYTPEMQQAIITRYAPVGASLMVNDVAARRQSIIEGTVEITVAKGLDEYGDEAFHQGLTTLAHEAWHEYIDACFRFCLIAWNRDGRPWPLP